jgi:hypothetical protein
MLLKWSSISFSVASSLIFCVLIRWIHLLWLGMRPGGRQRGDGAVSGAVVLEGFFCLEVKEIGWSSLGNWTVQFGSHRELVPAFVMVSAFTSGTLFCSVCHLLWTILRIGFCFAIGQRLAPQPCPPLTALWLIDRGSILQCILLVPAIRSCCCLLGNQTIQV